MRIGIVSLWFERGQAYLTKNVITALEDAGHYVHLMARAGMVHGKKFLDTTGEWSRENMTTNSEYLISKEILSTWIKDQKFDAVIFIEEQWQVDPMLTSVAKECGVKVFNVVMREAYNTENTDFYKDCDGIICPTKSCAEYVMSDFPRTAYHVKWGIDFTEIEAILEKKLKRDDKDIRFFHPGGWGGMHNRRGTADALAAFNIAVKDEHDSSPIMLLTAQTPEKEKKIAHITSKAQLVTGTLERETLMRYYLFSDVIILPSSWEGLGLTFLEALGAGLVIVTNDAPPMNEFVRDGKNGKLVQPLAQVNLKGIYVPAVDTNIEGMAESIKECFDRKLVNEMKKNSLEIARTEWDWKVNGKRLVEVVCGY